MNSRTHALIALLGLMVLSGCRDLPVAMGSANAIMVATPAERWVEIRDVVEEGLEPRVLTVRQERKFVVTHADPLHQRWPRLREFRRVLLAGTRDEAFMSRAVRQIPDEVTAPAVVELRDVWARGQQVIVLLLPSGVDAETAVSGLLSRALELVQADLERHVAERMYASGVDEEMIARMRRSTGAALRIPALYRDTVPDEQAYHAWNDHPDPAELIRSVLIRYVEGHHEPTHEAALEWRAAVAETDYPFRQVTGSERIETQSIRTDQYEGVEVQGIWTFPPGEWPGAGSFITRMVYCPGNDRTYLLDGWLYAPSRDKYEYQLQLRNILNSFDCR